VTDRELLELAAKAAGIEGEYVVWRLMGMKEGIRKPSDKTSIPWNSLTDDHSALRLAVKLKISVLQEFDRVIACYGGDEHEFETEFLYEKPTPTDLYAATRRAITRAAAQIGKEIK
jgi:hypothetical protein